MANKRQVGASSLDHLFGPKDSSSPPSTSSGLFGSIFSQPLTGLGKDSGIAGNPGGSGNYGNPENINRTGKGESTTRGINVKEKDSIYQNETAEPCYFSSSIYYGGQENYSPKTKNSESHHHHTFKKDGGDDDPNSNNPHSASRGNWWQGSLYY